MNLSYKQKYNSAEIPNPKNLSTDDSIFDLVDLFDIIKKGYEFLEVRINELVDKRIEEKLYEKEYRIRKLNKQKAILFSGYYLSGIGILSSVILEDKMILIVSLLFLLGNFIHNLDFNDNK